MTGRPPPIALIRTGGTIDSLGASPLDLYRYYETGQHLAEGTLAGELPDLARLAEVDEVTFRQLSSTALQPRDWLELTELISTLARGPRDYRGVVVTHGTNTMEETAFFLHLTVSTNRPVVLVGAMRPASALGADGFLNLLRAIAVAVSPDASGQGVLVVVNDLIFSARDVTKTNTMRVDAFAAPGLGPLGFADADGAVRFYHRHERGRARLPVFDVDRNTELPRVDVVVSHVGADGALIDAAVSAGARGIVSAGTGAGRVTPAEEEAFDRAVTTGVVVVQASRVGSGRVPQPLHVGRISADNLAPWKARILLSLALTVTDDPTRIRAYFDGL